MRVGLMLGEGLPFRDIVEFGVAAEAAGLDSVWHTEIQREPFVTLAAIAARTSRIRVGTGVAIWARSPVLAALAAANLDELSDGRFIYGLGTGPKEWNRRFHGMSYDRPVQRIREYVDVVRGVWTAHDGASFDYEGELYRVEGFSRTLSQRRERIPVFLAAVQEGMLGLAGEVADGVLCNVFTTGAYLRGHALPHLERGLERGGRTRSDLELGAIVTTAVDADRATARRWARHHLAFYGVIPYFDTMFRIHGFEREAAALRAAAAAGDTAGQIAAVSEAMIDVFAVAGTPDEARRRLRDWSELDLAVLFPPAFGLGVDEIAANHRTILETFAAG